MLLTVCATSARRLARLPTHPNDRPTIVWARPELVRISKALVLRTPLRAALEPVAPRSHDRVRRSPPRCWSETASALSASALSARLPLWARSIDVDPRVTQLDSPDNSEVRGRIPVPTQRQGGSAARTRDPQLANSGYDFRCRSGLRPRCCDSIKAAATRTRWDRRERSQSAYGEPGKRSCRQTATPSRHAIRARTTSLIETYRCNRWMPTSRPVSVRKCSLAVRERAG
jgi:hypothetical protein